MKLILLLFCLLNVCALRAQNLPLEFHYSEDGQRLLRGGKTNTGLYDLTEIKTVELIFQQSNYWKQLRDNYETETPIVATLIYDDIVIGEVGVRFRGHSSYAETYTSDKKSFKIDVDFVNDGLRVEGYKNLRFNNAHEDPSFMRELLYGKLASRYTPMVKVNFIHLFINGEDWGLYVNSQHPDKTYLDEWYLSNDGAFFRASYEDIEKSALWDGTAALNYLGDDTISYQSYYTLKSSDIDNAWQKLVNACYILNLSNADNKDLLEQIFSIDQTLWYLAIENIFTDEDSYVQKGKEDYLAYIDAETGLMFPMEYDGNSTFKSNYAAHPAWRPLKNVDNPNYPLLNKLLNIPEYRQRYLAHYRTILDESLNGEKVSAWVDSLDMQIRQYVINDSKKLYSFQAYTESIEELKDFAVRRNEYLNRKAEVQEQGPVFSKVTMFNKNMEADAAPLAGDPAIIKAWLSLDIPIKEVNLYYSSEIFGAFNVLSMLDDGNHNDNQNNDGIYAAEIPGVTGGIVRYYVEAIANTNNRSASYFPAGAENEVFFYNVKYSGSEQGVVINELMASNSSTATDEEGKYEDWVELFNNNDFDVNLDGFYLSDDTTELDKWQFGVNSTIKAKDYLIIWTDDDENDGPLHTSFKLSADGEFLILSNPNLDIVDQVEFGEQSTDFSLARFPNGVGDFRVQVPTFNATNGEITGVEEITQTEESVIVYPNPVQNMLHIIKKQEVINNQLMIFNSVGQKVYAGNREYEILDVSKWSPGLYIIVFGDERHKFIKQ